MEASERQLLALQAGTGSTGASKQATAGVTQPGLAEIARSLAASSLRSLALLDYCYYYICNTLNSAKRADAEDPS